MLMCAGPMHIGGVYIDPQQALEILGAVGAVGLTTVFGFLFVRRARAARLRQIEVLETDRPPIQPTRRRLRAEDLEEDSGEGEPEEAPPPPPPSAAKARRAPKAPEAE